MGRVGGGGGGGGGMLRARGGERENHLEQGPVSWKFTNVHRPLFSQSESNRTMGIGHYG